MNIKDAFAKLCADHDLTSIALAMNTLNNPNYAWTCTVHYSGYCLSGIPCSSEYAATPQEAIAKVLVTARVERTPPITMEDVGELVIEDVAE